MQRNLARKCVKQRVKENKFMILSLFVCFLHFLCVFLIPERFHSPRLSHPSVRKGRRGMPSEFHKVPSPQLRKQ